MNLCARVAIKIKFTVRNPKSTKWNFCLFLTVRCGQPWNGRIGPPPIEMFPALLVVQREEGVEGMDGDTNANDLA